MHQLGWLLHHSTPLILGILDVISKIIGGVYILIAMIWKDSIGARPQIHNTNMITDKKYSPKAIQYDKLSADRSYD